MSEQSIQEIHDICIATTADIMLLLGWGNISVSVLSDDDKNQLKGGEFHRVLDWEWAMERYQGVAEDGVLGISLKVIDHRDLGSLHAVILCKYDPRRSEFSICMVENFLAELTTPLTGNVFIIALIYSTTFCDITDIEDILIQDPTDAARPRYISYGFAPVWSDANKMSASLSDIKQRIVDRISHASS